MANGYPRRPRNYLRKSLLWCSIAPVNKVLGSDPSTEVASLKINIERCAALAAGKKRKAWLKNGRTLCKGGHI